jgi:hypothetical protein
LRKRLTERERLGVLAVIALFAGDVQARVSHETRRDEGSCERDRERPDPDPANR